MVTQGDLIWIEEATEEYNRSRQWLQKQIDNGVLATAEIPGDRRIYLLRSELDALFKPKISRRTDDQQVG